MMVMVIVVSDCHCSPPTVLPKYNPIEQLVEVMIVDSSLCRIVNREEETETVTKTEMYNHELLLILTSSLSQKQFSSSEKYTYWTWTVIGRAHGSGSHSHISRYSHAPQPRPALYPCAVFLRRHLSRYLSSTSLHRLLNKVIPEIYTAISQCHVSIPFLHHIYLLIHASAKKNLLAKMEDRIFVWHLILFSLVSVSVLSLFLFVHRSCCSIITAFTIVLISSNKGCVKHLPLYLTQGFCYIHLVNSYLYYF